MQVFKVLEDRRRFLALREEMRALVTSKFTDDDITHDSDVGSIKPFDAHYLANVLRRYKPATILEVGSYLGLSGRWILEVSELWQADLTCLDPNIPHWRFPNPKAIRDEFFAPFSHRNLQSVTGFFAKVGEGMNDVPPEVIAAVPMAGPKLEEAGHSYDMIFLDGDHTYEVVKEDFALARRLLKPGGTVVFHDAISWGGVAQLLQELRPMHKVRVLGRALDVVGKKVAHKGMDGIAVLEI